MALTVPLSLTSLNEVLARDPQRPIKLYAVKGRRAEVFLPPSASDFTLEEINTELAGEDGVISIVRDPNCTLHNYDFTERRAMFVKTDGDKDLYTYPFLYLAQLENATHAYSVPIELLEKVLLKNSGTEFSFNEENTSLKSDEQVLFLFSTGRCGSTLLCKVLGKIPGVLGLQEPEPFCSLSYLRNTHGATDEEVITLLRLSLLAHCKPKLNHPGNVSKWVFKFASQVTEYMDLFPRAFPKSQNLFMYRNAEGVTKSIAKMFPDLERELDPLDAWTALFSGLNWVPGDKKYLKDTAAVYWLTTMHLALKYKNAGMRCRCIRYEELVAETEKVVRELVKIFNIELRDEDMAQVLEAMKGHSQDGAFAVHEHKGLDEVMTRMRKFVAEHKEIGRVDFILPDTVLN
eukprot:Phypoly_transcript_09797.p1 GENE.Phypoly_transcript_09797~~Phypoly_transcript_09797.p1  ORF type:complete len:403 (+),score=59.49 Phypoly_transcript_09797:126-1334(+)